MTTISDLATYRRLCDPRPRQEVNEAISRFFDLLRAARLECGIPDVVVGVSGQAQCGERDGRAMTWMRCGDVLNAEPLAAYVPGQASAASSSRRRSHEVR